MANKTQLVFGNALNEPTTAEREQGDLYFDTGTETDRLVHFPAYLTACPISPQGRMSLKYK